MIHDDLLLYIYDFDMMMHVKLYDLDFDILFRVRLYVLHLDIAQVGL